MFSNCFFSTDTCTSVVFLGPSRLGQIGNFSSGIGKKNIFFGIWNSAPNSGDRESCLLNFIYGLLLSNSGTCFNMGFVP